MGLAKKAEAQTAVAEAPKVESSTNAAIERLKAGSPAKEGGSQSTKTQYKQRDFDAEARGKTRCVQFEAALMSPAIAGMAFQTMKEYLAFVKEAADAGVAYTFQDNA